jgi:hypothetical protein
LTDVTVNDAEYYGLLKGMAMASKRGDLVWLYIPNDQHGLGRKMVRQWHGPFPIAKVRDNLMVKLKIEDTRFRFIPWVHTNCLRSRAVFPERPTIEIKVDEENEFDAALLPEHSWKPDSGRSQFQVETMLDYRAVAHPRA